MAKGISEDAQIHISIAFLIKAMVAETKMDYKELKSIFRRKTDTYFDAEQALEWGLADEIV